MGLFTRNTPTSYPPMYYTEPKKPSTLRRWLLLDLLLLLAFMVFYPSFFPNLPFVRSLSHLIPTNLTVPWVQAAQPNAATADGSMLLVGKPSLSADFINQVLALAHSPATGTGEQLYDLSQQYGIDDAIALAFFKEESQYGTTGVARYTRSLGNIRCSSGYRCMYGYRSYTSYPAGYADWYQLIKNLYVNTWHLSTVQRIVPVYAPASDRNNPPAYIKTVLQAVTLWREGTVQA